MPKDLELTLTVQKVFDVLEQDWLYDLLPGDGADDFILSQLRMAIVAAAKEENAQR